MGRRTACSVASKECVSLIKLGNQFIYMRDDIVDPRTDSGLRLKHPCDKLIESLGVRRTRPGRPFLNLGIYDGTL